jgi:peptide/nickel transport system permease protein
MRAFLLRRLLTLPVVLFGLACLIFFIGRLLPGDPVGLAAGPDASAQTIAALRQEFHMDESILVQFVLFLSDLLQGDWGQSILTRRPVAADVLTFLPATMELVITSMIIATLVGVPAGVVSAVYSNRWPDYLTRLFSFTAVCVPPFFVGILAQLVFSMELGLTPLGSRFPVIDLPPHGVTGFLTIDSLISGDWNAFKTALWHLLLPAATLSSLTIATASRITRASMLEVLSRDFITTERALGISEARIVMKYALKNALTSTVTMLGLSFGWMLGGTVLVETVFDWPGIGLYATQAIVTQDFNPVIGVTLVIGIIFIITNLIVDLLYGLLNPQVRYR